MALLGESFQPRRKLTIIIELEDIVRLVESIGAHYDPEGTMTTWLSLDEVIVDVEQVLAVSLGVESADSLDEELAPFAELMTSRQFINIHRLLGGRSIVSIALYNRYGGLSIDISEG